MDVQSPSSAYSRQVRREVASVANPPPEGYLLLTAKPRRSFAPALEPIPSYYTRNAWAFVLDMGLFHVAMNFLGSTTVLPSFVATLTESEVIVGLASGIMTGAWMLPQLFVASYVGRLRYKKPFILRTAFLSRPILFVLALVIWQFGSSAPTLTLVATLVLIFLFFAFDAVGSVPWFDLLARALPTRRRGRVQGLAQVLGGIGGLGAGAIVRYVLSDKSALPFPASYASLFAMGGSVLMVSASALFFIHEPEPKTRTDNVLGPREILRSLPRLVVRDRPFMRLIIVRLVSGFVGVASAFYVLNATRNLGFGPEDTGLFVSAQVVGGLAAGLGIGFVQDRWGPLVHIRLITLISVLPPIIALLSGPLAPILGEATIYLYLLVFFFVGFYMGNVGWPYFNWILEYAEESRRPLYIGTSNTLGALLMLAPTLGGWIVNVKSYTAAFWTAMAFAIVGLLMSLSVPSTRRVK